MEFEMAKRVSSALVKSGVNWISAALAIPTLCNPLTAKDAAKILNIPVSKVYPKIYENRLRPIYRRDGKAYYHPIDMLYALRRWIPLDEGVKRAIVDAIDSGLTLEEVAKICDITRKEVMAIYKNWVRMHPKEVQ